MTFDARTETMLRHAFKYFNRFMIAMWRLGLGPWLNQGPDWFGRYMIIVSTGHKTGLRRQTPVNFARIGGDLYCTAGFGKVAHWYRNMIHNPQVEVWLPDGWWEGVAEEVTNEPGHTERMRAVLLASGFAANAAGVGPKQMSDAELDAATSTYRLMRIRLTQPRTGEGGPGDLVWVWPVITSLLLLALLRKRR